MPFPKRVVFKPKNWPFVPFVVKLWKHQLVRLPFCWKMSRFIPNLRKMFNDFSLCTVCWRPRHDCHDDCYVVMGRLSLDKVVTNPSLPAFRNCFAFALLAAPAVRADLSFPKQCKCCGLCRPEWWTLVLGNLAKIWFVKTRLSGCCPCFWRPRSEDGWRVFHP